MPWSATVTEDGQIEIPAEIRARLRVEARHAGGVCR